MSQRPITIVLGGGAGTRLFPLTKDRSKPAVPIAGKFRLIDIPISNCLNSELYHIFILTQFNSGSLNQHVSRSYPMPHFLNGFVEVLAANMTPNNPHWYRGTADAVRQNLWYMTQVARRRKCRTALILSGDHLYRMDYRHLLRFHEQQQADITVGVLPVTEEEAPEFGLLHVNPEMEIVRFVEKPKDPDVLGSLRVEGGEMAGLSIPPERPFLASMGIYVFSLDVLQDLLEKTDFNDFGKEILPTALGHQRLFAYPFQGYWRDIGTIRAYYEANLEMCNQVPAFDFFPENAPFYTRPRSLAPARLRGVQLEQSLIADGVHIQPGCRIRRSVVGLRSQIGENAELREVILFGATHYEDRAKAGGALPEMGIGAGSTLHGCLIDKDVRIGRGVTINRAAGYADGDYDGYYIRDELVIVPRKAILEDGREIPGPEAARR